MFKNNHRILTDLVNDIYTHDAKKYDELVKFCDDYWYSNGYNSKEQFERVRDDDYEGGLIKEVDKATNIYDKLLGDY